MLRWKISTWNLSLHLRVHKISHIWTHFFRFVIFPNVFQYCRMCFTFSHSVYSAHRPEPRLFPSTQRRTLMMWIHSYITFLCFLVLFCFCSTLSRDRQHRLLINPCACRCSCEQCVWIWGMRQPGYVNVCVCEWAYAKGENLFLEIS